MARSIFVNDRAVRRELQLDFARLRFSFDFDLFALDAHLFPFAAKAIFIRIGGLHLFDTKALLRTADRRGPETENPGLSGRRRGERWRTACAHVPAAP